MSSKRDLRKIYEEITVEFKKKFLTSKSIEKLFEVYRDDLSKIIKRKSTTISRDWFNEKAKPEIYTKRAIEEIFNKMGIPSTEIIEEKALSSKKSIFSGKLDKYPDFMIPKGEGSDKSLLIEIERIGKSLTVKDEGIEQVRKWFGPEFAGTSEDYNALATNFSDWVFFRRKREGYGMQEVLVSPEQALEIVSDTYFGKATTYSIDSIEKHHEKIDKFYKEFNERLKWILDNLEEESTKHRDIKVLGIPKYIIEELRKKIAIRYYRTIFFRLLFIKIIEEWKLIKIDPIRIIFDQDPSYHSSLFQQLFFDIFNKTDEERMELDLNKIFLTLPYLNGGLFRKNEYERIYSLKLTSNTYKDIWKMLKKYSFTKDKTGKEFLDPEVLGYIFEKTLEATGSRKSTGSYYTPKIITDYMSKSSIESLIIDRLNKYLREEDILDYSIETINEIEILEPEIKNLAYFKLIDILKELKICDNASGSGAFIKSSADYILRLFNKLYQNFKWSLPYHSEMEIEGDRRPFKDLYELKKHILQNNLYGLDILPEAIEICELRLWLWLIKPPKGLIGEFLIEPLPNIDYNIQIGNSLIGFIRNDELGEGLLKWATPTVIEYENILKQYYKEISNSTLTEGRKTELEELKKKAWFKLNTKLLERLYNELPPKIKKGESDASKLEDINSSKSAFLESLLPFHWFIAHNDVMKKGGFDIIIGNPPYGNIFPQGSKKVFKTLFKTFNASNPDIYHQFIERSHRLIKKEGYLIYIIPDTLLRKIQLGGLRRYFATKTLIELIECGRVFKDVPSMQSIIIKCVKKPHSSYKHIVINSKKVKNTLSIIKNQRYISESIPFDYIKTDSVYRINHYIKRKKLRIINYIEDHTQELREITNLKITRGTEGGKNLIRNTSLEGFTEIIIPNTVERNLINYGKNFFPRNKLTGSKYDYNKVLIIRIRNINIRPRLISAIDNLKIPCMKTLQFIYEEDNKNANIFYLMVILNSNLMEFFAINYLTDDLNKSFLELLPIPTSKIDFKEVLSIIGQYQEYLRINKGNNLFDLLANYLIYELYFHSWFYSNLKEKIYSEDKLLLISVLFSLIKPISFTDWITLYRKKELGILNKNEGEILRNISIDINETIKNVFESINNTPLISEIIDKIKSHSWIKKIEETIFI